MTYIFSRIFESLWTLVKSCVTDSWDYARIDSLNCEKHESDAQTISLLWKEEIREVVYDIRLLRSWHSEVNLHNGGINGAMVL